MVLELPWAQKQIFWVSEKSFFQFFANFWVTKSKLFYGKVRQNIKTFFKSKFRHGKLLGKWLWSYLELKNEFSERLKRAFLSFLQIFEWRRLNRFLGKRDNASKTFCVKSALFGGFWKILISFYLITPDNLCYNFRIFRMFWIFPFEYKIKQNKNTYYHFTP